MSDPLNRFTSRVESYTKFRPSYPPSVLNLLKTECGLSIESVIADIGSGTGILTQLFLKLGNTVFAVEPNQAMRTEAEGLLSSYPNFLSVEGAAEATTLETNSVNLITAAQAFHWFDALKAREEFVRVLRPQGWVVLIWNERRLDSSPFLRAYEKLLMRYGTDYQQVRHENTTGKIADFFKPQSFRFDSFENIQSFDFEGLQGRVLSASYTPEPDQPNFKPMMAGLREIFDAHHKNGQVNFEYDTTMYYGHLESR